jgi:hypothetical protein
MRHAVSTATREHGRVVMSSFDADPSTVADVGAPWMTRRDRNRRCFRALQWRS